MKINSKTALTNLLLILGIVITLWLGYVQYFGGPAQVYKEQDRLYLETLVEYQDLDSAQLLNRFSLDKVYYIVKVQKDGEFSTAWFDTDYKNFKTYKDADTSKAIDYAQANGISYKSIEYGVYDEELVYVIKTKNYSEIYIDVESLEIVLDGRRS